MVAARRSLIPIVLLGGAVLVALSCRDASPMGVDVRKPVVFATDPQDESVDDGDDGDDGDESEDSDSLVSCRPLRADSVTRTMGPSGGILEVRHRSWLIVPAGALSAPVTITAIAPSDTVALVRFEPEGLRFQKNVVLVLAYDNCRVPRDVTPRIALVTDALDVIEYLAPVGAPGPIRHFLKGRSRHSVIGQVQHFSNYAVAW